MKTPQLNDILRITAQALGKTVSDITTYSKTRETADLRMVALLMIYELIPHIRHAKIGRQIHRTGPEVQRVHKRAKGLLAVKDEILTAKYSLAKAAIEKEVRNET